MQELSAVFGQVQELLSAGISIIPVRDKPTTNAATGTVISAKVAYSGWKKYQSEIISKEQLWHEMEHFDTTAIAMVCGAVSGNLEIIDIDCKHWPGIDGRLFVDMKQIYPDLFARLRIHKTPSGGYHILYRIADGIAGRNQKLAWKADIKECGIETRGEGGYALAPPSMGYSIHAGANIPLITSLERDGLINLCKSYNEKITIVKPPTPSKANFDYYDENPFDHFNGSPGAESILDEHGYIIFNDHTAYRRWTRPGRDAAGVSVTFRKDYRLYYFFTTSTEFESGKWYSPATVLAILMFGGDKKKLHSYLVSKGYGRIRPDKEREIATRATTYKTTPPPNLSDEAKQWVNDALAKATEQHPYGIFWAVNDKGGTVISRERLYSVSEQMGYRLHLQTITRIEGYKIHEYTPRQYYDILRAYIKIEDAEEYEKVFNSLDEFLQKNGAHIVATLPLLDTANILQSNKRTGYKLYQNCYVEIDKDGWIIREYSELAGKFIWAKSIQQRDYSLIPATDLPHSMYYKYLQLSTGLTPHVMQCMGYLIHEFKDTSDSYIIVLVEQCENPKQGGGSGKNMFSSFLQYMTSWKDIPGTQVSMDNKFLQAWNYERVMCLTDVPKKFNFLHIKPLSDGSGIVKKLFKDERTVSPSEMPKLMVSTNYSYEVSDGGLARRIKPIEFTDFFTKSGGVDTYFGKMMPADWTAHDWLCYDNIMLSSLQAYLQIGKLGTPPLSVSGWSKQFEQEYGPLTYQFITENISEWQTMGKLAIKDFNKSYDDFFVENNGNKSYKLTSIKMNAALDTYCKNHKIYFEAARLLSVNSIKDRYKIFSSEQIKDEKPPF